MLQTLIAFGIAIGGLPLAYYFDLQLRHEGIPRDMTHLGVDLSSYQGELNPGDISALKFVGVEFAYVKATQGDTYVNPDALQQVNALRAAGILVGLYHFYDVTVGAKDQAVHFFLQASILGGSDLPLGLDVEEEDPAGWQDLAYNIVAFAMQIETEPNVIRNRNTIFYVNGNFYENLSPLGFPWGRGIWYAEPDVSEPTRPCEVWQQAPRVLANLGSIDPDLFVGNEAQWASFLSEPTPAPPATPAPTPPTTPTTGGQVLQHPPVPQPQEFDMATLPNVGSGAVGLLVKSVQTLLRYKFDQQDVNVSGSFDSATLNGVKAVQTFFKIPVDGVVGPETWGILLEL